jgi:hypothetical protein
MMTLKLSKSALKFLNHLSPKEQLKIKQKLKFLVDGINNNENIPFQELDIKSLTGDWKGYLTHIPQLRAEKKIVHLYYFFLRRFIVDFNNFIKNPV